MASTPTMHGLRLLAGPFDEKLDKAELGMSIKLLTDKGRKVMITRNYKREKGLFLWAEPMPSTADEVVGRKSVKTHLQQGFWKTVDWSLTNEALMAKYNVSRSYVNQQRRVYGPKQRKFDVTKR